jgi:hypothetical protein
VTCLGARPSPRSGPSWSAVSQATRSRRRRAPGHASSRGRSRSRGGPLHPA